VLGSLASAIKGTNAQRTLHVRASPAFGALRRWLVGEDDGFEVKTEIKYSCRYLHASDLDVCAASTLRFVGSLGLDHSGSRPSGWPGAKAAQTALERGRHGAKRRRYTTCRIARPLGSVMAAVAGDVGGEDRGEHQ
jgi:hypothetical protein